MADAAVTAFGLLKDEKYLATFCRAHDWFHGQNSLREPLADSQSGACFDGLQASAVNRNQGAESTLAYLWTQSQHTELRQSLGDSRKVRAVSAYSDKETAPH